MVHVTVGEEELLGSLHLVEPVAEDPGQGGEGPGKTAHHGSLFFSLL